MNNMLKKKGLWHLKPTFSHKISRVVKLCFFQVANKKPKTFSFCTLKQKVSWFQCGSSEDRWMPFIVDSVKRDLTSVATRQGHLWNLYWWLPNPGKWVEAQWGTSSWLIFYLFLSLIMEGSRLRNAINRGRYRHYIPFFFNLQVSFWVQNASRRWWFFWWLSEKHGARLLQESMWMTRISRIKPPRCWRQQFISSAPGEGTFSISDWGGMG